MAIFVYHGEDIVNSRKAFVEKIEQFRLEGMEIIKTENKSLTDELLENIFGNTGLFGNINVLALESFFTGPKSKQKEKTLNKIFTEKEGIIIFWEGKELSKTDISSFPKGTIFNIFKTPQLLFSFLDSLFPERAAENIKYFRKLLENTEAELVFSMMERQFRLMILSLEKETAESIPVWQRSKLKKQAEAFGIEKIKDIFKKLMKIDYNQKTSGSPLAFEKQIELLLEEM